MACYDRRQADKLRKPQADTSAKIAIMTSPDTKEMRKRHLKSPWGSGASRGLREARVSWFDLDCKLVSRLWNDDIHALIMRSKFLDFPEPLPPDLSLDVNQGEFFRPAGASHLQTCCDGAMSWGFF